MEALFSYFYCLKPENIIIAKGPGSFRSGKAGTNSFRGLMAYIIASVKAGVDDVAARSFTAETAEEKIE